ncbi:F0F1 ATP synthase subunit A [Poriferisphaera corsica]|uniref:F0F1 ATP synthase subunit A n=1 Tax=Poriferisphaera corsica TaxID=2528020 RepID=UPI00190A5FD6|nr:F0F1 ATP synthase subunit A [Poriferisphaera corsica]
MSSYINILAEENLLVHVLPQSAFKVGNFTIYNQMVLTGIAALIVLLIFGYASRKIRTNQNEGLDGYVTKGRFAQLLEVLCVFIREEVARPNLGNLTDKYIKYIWSVFFFVLTINLVGMVPAGPFFAEIASYLPESTQTGIVHALEAIGATPHPYGADKIGLVTWLSHLNGNANGNLNMTAAMAVLSFIAIVGIGMKEQGLKYFAHFAPVPFTPILMSPIAGMLVVIEAMGVVIKCVVLAMRLFGTMLAGHLVLAALFSLILAATKAGGFIMEMGVGVLVVGGATALSLLELFFAVLQAFIFTFLTVLFISAGAVHHGEHDHDEEHEFEPKHDKGMEGIEGVSL